jgi:hypothetical protein
MTPHRYDSGVGFDTAPNDPIFPCCDAPFGDPIHDVPCERCGQRASTRHYCNPEPTP